MKNNQNTISPSQALQRIKEGNSRFISGIQSIEPMLSRYRMAEMAEKGQKPFAIVLTCSDSRSPAELIFDQGIGDLFLVRVAGNVVAPSLLASIEFAAANFGSPLILVLAHTKCGAINAAINFSMDPSKGLPSVHLEELVGRLRPAVDTVTDRVGFTSKNIVEKVTVENLKRSMKLIVSQSTIVQSLIEQGSLKIEGAVLDISTGKVNFLSEQELQNHGDNKYLSSAEAGNAECTA